MILETKVLVVQCMYFQKFSPGMFLLQCLAVFTRFQDLRRARAAASDASSFNLDPVAQQPKSDEYRRVSSNHDTE